MKKSFLPEKSVRSQGKQDMKKDETRLGLIPGKLWRGKLQPVFPGNWDKRCAPTQSSVSQSVSHTVQSLSRV